MKVPIPTHVHPAVNEGPEVRHSHKNGHLDHGHSPTLPAVPGLPVNLKLGWSAARQYDHPEKVLVLRGVYMGSLPPIPSQTFICTWVGYQGDHLTYRQVRGTSDDDADQPLRFVSLDKVEGVYDVEPVYGDG